MSDRNTSIPGLVILNSRRCVALFKKKQKEMLAFTLRRALQAIGVMIAVGIISFSMFRFVGDPVSQIVSIDTSAAERAEIRKSLGLDDPVAVQFLRYFTNATLF